MMVRWRYVHMPALDWPVLGKRYGKTTTTSQKRGEDAPVRAYVHDNEYRCRAGDREARDDASKRLKTTSGSRDHHDCAHHLTLT